MALVSGADGWRPNTINRGTPYHVAIVGPYKLPQVVDAAGTVALSGPDGAVFCACAEQADELCRLANSGNLFPFENQKVTY